MSEARFTAEQVIAAVEGSYGIQTAIAKRLGCSRHSVASYINRWPSVAAAVAQERERLVDLAEVKLVKCIDNEDAWAIGLVLKTLGKDRGYVERQELTGKDGEAVALQVTERIVTKRDG